MRSLSSVYKSRSFIANNEKVPIPDVIFEEKKPHVINEEENPPEVRPFEPEKLFLSKPESSPETAQEADPEMNLETDPEPLQGTEAAYAADAEEEIKDEPAPEPEPEPVEIEMQAPPPPPPPPPPPVTKELIGEFYADELSNLANEVAQQAYYDALNKKKAELRDCIAGVQALMDEMVCAQQKFIEEYTKELKYMAVDIAEKIIFERIAEDDLTLERLVMQTVSIVKNADWLNVEISERLVKLVDKINAELDKPEYNGRAHVFPIAGTDGVCRVVTNEGAIVSSVEVQAENLRKAFRNLDQQDTPVERAD